MYGKRAYLLKLVYQYSHLHLFVYYEKHVDRSQPRHLQNEECDFLNEQDYEEEKNPSSCERICLEPLLSMVCFVLINSHDIDGWKKVMDEKVMAVD